MARSIAEAIAEERMRFHGIMTCDEAQSRQKAALKLAMQGHSVEVAKDFLRDMPTEATAIDKAWERNAQAFEQAMTGETINIGSSKGGITGDRKAARLAELQAVGKAYSIGRGYRPAD